MSVTICYPLIRLKILIEAFLFLSIFPSAKIFSFLPHASQGKTSELFSDVISVRETRT